MRPRGIAKGFSVVAVAAVAGMAAGGCGSDDSRAAMLSDLRGRLYVAVDAKRHELVEDREATLTIGDQVIRASGGCNPDGTVAYALDHGRLEILPSFAYDQAGVGCRDDIERQDAWLYAFVRDHPTVWVRASGATLILKTAGDTVTFESRDRPEGRRTVPRADLDRFSVAFEKGKARLESDLAEVRLRLEAGTITRRRARAENARLFDTFERRNAAAAARMRASAR